MEVICGTLHYNMICLVVLTDWSHITFRTQIFIFTPPTRWIHQPDHWWNMYYILRQEGIPDSPLERDVSIWFFVTMKLGAECIMTPLYNGLPGWKVCPNLCRSGGLLVAHVAVDLCFIGAMSLFYEADTTVPCLGSSKVNWVVKSKSFDKLEKSSTGCEEKL